MSVIISSTVILILCSRLSAASDSVNDTDNLIKKSGGFLFSMPKTLVADQNETVCLTLHEVELPAKTIVDLKWKERHYITYRNFDTDHTCFDLFIPHLEIKEPNFVSVKVQVQLNGSVYSAHNLDPIIVYPKRIIKTFINTDRHVYKPGDKVRFRILVIDERLLPDNSKIPEIRIKTPLDVTAAIWENVVPENGLISLDYQMSPESLSGKWKIEVHDEHKIFEVFKYILPRFKIELIQPKMIYYQADSLNISVCGEYSYGKHVKGLAFIKVTDSLNRMRPVHKLKEMESGCATFTIPSTDMQIFNIKEKFPMYDPKMSIYITATITEKGTNRIDVTTGKILVFLKPYTMKFLHNPVFQPGLPYRGKLKLANVHVNLPGQALEICYNLAVKRSWNYINEEQCSTFAVDKDGSVDFNVLPLKNSVIHMKFNARSLNHTDIGDSLLAVRQFSHSNSHISLHQVVLEKSEDECRAPQQFRVMFTADKFSEGDNVTFYYMIKSSFHIYKQRKIVHQVRKKVPNFDEEDRLVGRPHKFTKLGTSVDSFYVKFKLDKRILSKYLLLVYYAAGSEETVAISKTVDAEPCLMKVRAKWNQNQLVPGATATLNIKTGFHSLCSLSAIDKSTKFLSTGNQDLDIYAVVKTFYDEEREPPQSGRKTCIPPSRKNSQAPANLFESDSDDANSLWDLRKRRKRHVYSFSEDFDSYDMFDKFGTVVISNLRLVTKPCYSGPLMKPITPQVQFLTDYENHNEEQEVSVRSHFPETWLWELIPVSQSIQLNRHLPHTITNWITNVLCVSEEEGLGMSEQFELTTFQSFFVEVLTPHTVKREEAFYLTVHVSNHLGHTFPVRIIMSLSDGLELKNPDDKLAASHCLLVNSTVTNMLQVTATVTGSVNVTVLAEVDTQYPAECGPETILSKRDVVLKTILVESEGYPMKITKSALLCASSTKQATNLIWHLKTPLDLVPQTNKTVINLNADLLGNTIENLEELLDIPTGCGEQIMATVAPNLYALRYLNATDSLKPGLRQRIFRNLKIGYQRILNYVHKDGSFSAFGYHDPSGSMFLTAFVVSTLQDAKKYIYVDQRIIDRAAAWIFEHQLENGCFNTMLHVFQDMGGTSKENSTSSLTAYVMLSLIESDIEIPKAIQTNAKYCIRNPQNPDKYTLAVTCYALFKMNWPTEAAKMLKKLLAVAERQNDMLWWTIKENESSATDIEITSYILLSLLHENTSESMANARSVVRWLSTKYGPKGGFHSTQDTVIALDALAKYSKLIKLTNLDLGIKLEAGIHKENLTLKNSDKMKSKAIALNQFGDADKINVNVQGAGCVLIQVVHSYYLKTIPKSEAFKLAVETSPVSTIDQCSINNFSPCLAYTGPDGISNMAVMEVTLPTGYEADRASLYRLVESEDTSRIKMFEEHNNKVNLYFTKLDKQLVCFEFNINEYTSVEARKSSLVKLYDYYNPEYEILQYYQINDKCKNVNFSAQIPELVGKPMSTKIRLNNITIELNAENETTEKTNTDEETLFEEQSDEKIAEIHKRDLSEEIQHLNPDFVNVDINLDMPNSMEGNLEIFVDPGEDLRKNLTLFNKI